MCKTIIVSLVVGVTLSGFNTVIAQSVTATIDRDIRIFTTAAALNAAGFDIELGPQYHPVREQVRSHLESLEPDLRIRLEDFYEQHKSNESDEEQFAKYVSLALSLTDPPLFEFAYDEEFIPPDARELAEFLPLLREFYLKAGIPPLWTRVRGYYETSLDALGPPLREVILQSNIFLRVPLGGSRDRQLVILLALAAPVNSVNVRNYQDNLYIVFGHLSDVPVKDVRHAYLHLLLDSLVRQYRDNLEKAAELITLLEGVDGVGSQLTDDFAILATESLIRAVEIRMDRLVGAPATEAVEGAYRTGLLLTPLFHEELEKFTMDEAGILEYFQRMLLAIDLEVEKTRFEEKFFKIELPDSPVIRAEVPPGQPIPGEMRQILRNAQLAFNSGRNDIAYEAFHLILLDFDETNGPALYGLALIASREGDSELAEDYFARTIQSSTAETSMTVWSHIFLGRIYDIACKRDAALEQYGKALRTGDDTRGAQAAAQSGRESPFGDGCQNGL